MEIKETIVHRVSNATFSDYFNYSEAKIKNETLYSVRFVKIGKLVVRIKCYDIKLDSFITREMSFVTIPAVPEHFDYTIYACLSHEKFSEMKNHWVVDGDASDNLPVISIDGETGRTIIYNEEQRSFYYFFTSSVFEELAKELHVFFRQFYKMLKPLPNTSLVHGACVGINGNGVLLCAKSNKGKSTLTVLSLLKGFEYVSDDYLVLEKRDQQLYASPIYSIVTLSPTMYDEMYNELEGTRFISNNFNKSKYILSIANHHDKIRFDYPIKACLQLEFVQDVEPSIVLCSSAEKGNAIANMVLSTTFQVGDSTDVRNNLKLINLINDQVYFKIKLCRDIHKNVECLRQFIGEHRYLQH